MISFLFASVAFSELQLSSLVGFYEGGTQQKKIYYNGDTLETQWPTKDYAKTGNGIISQQITLSWNTYKQNRPIKTTTWTLDLDQSSAVVLYWKDEEGNLKRPWIRLARKPDDFIGFYFDEDGKVVEIVNEWDRIMAEWTEGNQKQKGWIQQSPSGDVFLLTKDMKKWWLSKDSSRIEGLRWEVSDEVSKIWKAPSAIDETQTEVAASVASFALTDASRGFVPMAQYVPVMAPVWDYQYEERMPTNDEVQYPDTPERYLSPERSLQNLLRADAPEFTVSNVDLTIEST